MPDGVQIKPVIAVPSRDSVPVKDFETTYRLADGNNDNQLTKDEIGTFQTLKGFALALSIGDEAKKKKYDESFGRTGEPLNVILGFWDQFDPKKTGAVPLSAITQAAQQDGKPGELSAEELGGRRYFDAETGKPIR